MAARFPIGPTKVELGFGLDLPWDQDPGLVKDPIRGDVVSDRVIELLEDKAASASHLSICWQPRRRTHVEARDYFPAYDDLFYVPFPSIRLKWLLYTITSEVIWETKIRGTKPKQRRQTGWARSRQSRCFPAATARRGFRPRCRDWRRSLRRWRR